jgi:DNA-directed DNA polymerase III PolC
MTKDFELNEQVKSLKPFQFITSDESYHEGLSRIESYIDSAIEKGIDTLALIDRNSLTLSVQFYKKCIAKGIKPMLGTRLMVDCPSIDYQDNIIKNQNVFVELSALEATKNNGEVTKIFPKLEVNIFNYFSKEENYQNLHIIENKIITFDKSKSKTRIFPLLRAVFSFFNDMNLSKYDLFNLGIFNNIELFYFEESFKLAEKELTKFSEKLNNSSEKKLSLKSLSKEELKLFEKKSLQLLLSENSETIMNSALKSYFKFLIDNKSLPREDTVNAKKTIDRIKFYDKNSFLEASIDKIKDLNEFTKEELSVLNNFDFIKLNKVDVLNISNYFNISSFISIIKNIDKEINYGDIIALAYNNEGVQNLRELITDSFTYDVKETKIKLETDGKRPVDSFVLSKVETLKLHSEGLLFFSCSDLNDIVGKNIYLRKRNGEKVLSLLKDELGKKLVIGIKKSTKFENDSYTTQEENLIECMIELSSKFNIPAIAIHDARFSEESQYEAFDIKRAMLLNEVVYDLSRKKDVFTGQYLLENDDFIKKFSNYPELIINNNFIKNKVDFKMKLDFNVLPDFPIPFTFENNILVEKFKELNLTIEESYSNEDMKNILKDFYIDEIKKHHPEHWDVELNKKVSNIVAGKYMDFVAWEGIVGKLKVDYGDKWESHVDEYKKRFEYESEVINTMGFPGYFLIVYDFIKYAKTIDVPVGPGRGSGAGSLIAYGMDITTVDPIPYDLFFERFLNPERVSMPDFDIDFAKFGRDLIIDYVKEKYGEVTQISTTGRLKPKSLFRGICKVTGHEIKYEDNIMHAIESVSEDPSLKLSDLKENEEFLIKYDNEVGLKDKFVIAEELNSLKNQEGKHAGGVVIAPTRMVDFCAVQNDKVQFDKNDIETAGLVKFDFLGLKTLDVVKETRIQIKENLDIDINIDTIDIKDKATFDMLKNHLTHAVFQLESNGMTELVKKLQVEDLEEISALVALFRPGPIQSGMVDKFINRKKGIEEIEVMHPKLEKSLSYTYGTMIYQEQVMQAAQILAGYSLGKADQLRRAMGGKKPEVMRQQKFGFIDGSLVTNKEDAKKEALDYFGMELDMELSDIAESDVLNIKEYLSENNNFALDEKTESFIKDTEILSEDDLVLFFMKINSVDFDINSMYPKSRQKAENIKDDELNKISEKMLNSLKNKIIHEKSEVYAMRIFHNIAQYARYSSIFYKIEQFAAYGFNKAHSLAYAVIAYQTAFLKANYAKEFFAGTLTFQTDDLENINHTINDMTKNFGIELLPPSVNNSFCNFKADKNVNGVRYGFSGIKSLGESGSVIEIERLENGNFVNLADLIYRIDYRNRILKSTHTKMGKKAIESLLYSGALDEFIPEKDFKLGCRYGRNFLYKEYELITKDGVYPKDDLVEIVENRFKNGNYSDDINYDGNESFNILQNIICKTIAYTKTEEDLFFDTEEKKAAKESVKKEKAEFTKDIKDLQKVIKTCEKLFSTDSSKIYKKIVTALNKKCKLDASIIVDEESFNKEKNKNEKTLNDLFLNITEYYLDIDDDVKVKIINEIDDINKKIINLISRYGDSEHVDSIEICSAIKQIHENRNKLDLLKKANVIKGLPKGLELLPVEFNSIESKNSRTHKVKQVYTYIKENNKNELSKIIAKIKHDVDITDKFIYENEKFYTGIYITGHPIDVNNAYSRFSVERNATDISDIKKKANSQELEDEVHGYVFNIIGVIEEVKIKKIKSGDNAGKDWASLTIQDKTETTRVSLFAELFDKIKDYLQEGNVIGMSVSAKISDDWGLQLTAQEIKSYMPDMLDLPFVKADPKKKKVKIII